MVKEMRDEEVKVRVKEIQEKMKGVKYIIIKIKYEVATGQMIVQHSPRKRYDAELILSLLLTSYQWLLNAFAKKGQLKNLRMVRVPETEAEKAIEEKKVDYIA